MGNRVKEVRLKVGLKQIALARRTGIDRAVLSMIENRWRQPNETQRARIRLVLGSEAVDGEQRQ